jgi:hypothetical protein
MSAADARADTGNELRKKPKPIKINQRRMARFTLEPVEAGSVRSTRTSLPI